MGIAPLPEPLRHIMQACAAGRMDGDSLKALRESSPRFVYMLCDGLMTDIATLQRMADEGRLTVDKIAEAMR
jgi:tape measure domain-containing protein